MVDELLTRRVHRTPLREALQPPLAIAPILEGAWRSRNAGGVNKQMLDRRGLLAVGPVLRHILNDLVRRTDFSFLDEKPQGRRSYRLGRGHRDENGFVGSRLLHAALHRATESFHRRDLALTGYCHLTCWKNAFFYVALGAIHERLHLVRIKTNFGRAISKEFFFRHRALSFGREPSVAAIVRHQS
jgi:hypothetical protein